MTKMSSMEGGKLALSNMVVKPRKKGIFFWSREWRRRDILYGISIFLLHILCLFAPFTFSWGAFWVAFMLGIVSVYLGIALSFHRNLAHQSFKLPKYLEYLFAYFGVHALQGDPIFWVSTHRFHHKVTDTKHDPHSPIEGFWFSHISWIFDYNYLMEKGGNYNNVQDLSKEWYYQFLRKTYVCHPCLLAILLYTFGGFPYIVWGIGVRIVWFYHVTFAVNSVCHTWGEQTWNTGDLSKNNWFIALFSFGEGWHNNHHAFPFSARQGLEWWQLDITWYLIKVLEYFGLATNVKVPGETHKAKMAFKTA